MANFTYALLSQHTNYLLSCWINSIDQRDILIALLALLSRINTNIQDTILRSTRQYISASCPAKETNSFNSHLIIQSHSVTLMNRLCLILNESKSSLVSYVFRLSNDEPKYNSGNSCSSFRSHSMPSTHQPPDE